MWGDTDILQELESPPSPTPPFKIDGCNLRDVDLYANFFTTLPTLPEGVTTLRLSVNGDEDPAELVESLSSKLQLKSINLQLVVREASIVSPLFTLTSCTFLYCDQLFCGKGGNVKTREREH